MSVTNIANADNKEEWLATRKGYLTASDIYTWIGDTPGWWGNTREDILAEKLHGAERKFDDEALINMAHGRFDEVNIGNKLAHALGAEFEPTNMMFVNSRFPLLAATIDGFLHTPRAEPGDDFCQDPEVLPALRTVLRHIDETVVCEIKKSVSVKWQTEVPDYYVSQVQTQMTILEMNYAVIVAETIKRVGRRTHWDLRPYVIERDPEWAGVLTRINKEFENATKPTT